MIQISNNSNKVTLSTNLKELGVSFAEYALVVLLLGFGIGAVYLMIEPSGEEFHDMMTSGMDQAYPESYITEAMPTPTP